MVYSPYTVLQYVHNYTVDKRLTSAPFIMCIYKSHLEHSEYLPCKLKILQYCLQAHRRVKCVSSNMNALLLVAIAYSLQFKCGHTQGALFSFAIYTVYKALCRTCVRLVCMNMNIDFDTICHVLCIFNKHCNVQQK